MKYPKAFEKWYEKNLANRGIVDYDKGEATLKDCCFQAWKAGLQKVDRKITFYNRIFDHNWQHEDVDSLQEFTRELYK